MAAILQNVLEKKVSADDLIPWLSRKDFKGKSEALKDLESIRPEFVPYLLNFLRDQTLHLIQGCRSATQSPAKTPSSLKKVKPVSVDTNSTSTPATSAPVKSNRIQLFASPFDQPISVRSRNKPSPTANTSVSLNFEASFSDTSLNTTTGSTPLVGTSFSKENTNSQASPYLDSPLNDSRYSRSGNNSFNTPDIYRNSPSFENASGAKNDSRFSNRSGSFSKTPDQFRSSPVNDHYHRPSYKQTPDPSRSKHKHSLGEFFVNPDFESGRKKKSPHSGRKDEMLQPLSVVGKKGKGRRSGDRRIQPIRIPAESSSPPVFSISNMEDFPQIGAPSQERISNVPSGLKVITASRRITPTPITASVPQQTSKQSAFMPVAPQTTSTPSVTFDAQPQVFKSQPVEGACSLEEERKRLREEKARWAEESTNITPSKSKVSMSETPTKVHTPIRPGLERLQSLSDAIQADFTMVTYEEQLNIIARTYVGCLEANLVSNVTVELYFLMQLLTCKGGEMDAFIDLGMDSDEINYFSTVHNAVYFAVKILSLQKRLLSLLDKSTIKLLADNSRIAEFDISLKEHLLQLHHNMSSKAFASQPQSPIGGVSFQADTDNRKNFPNDRAFHLFRKQRDQFYELIRDWEENHHSPGWSMADMLGERIRGLVSSRIELANHIHFARLFQSQLLQMCKGTKNVESEGDEANVELLTALKQANPEKFKKLQERFITPSSSGGPCPSPAFPGCQEFFRDFITAAASHVFNQHLTNSMASKISEMNSTQFTVSETSSREEIDQEERDALLSCLQTLRLLGKFLGFVTFLPYQTPDILPDTVQATYVSMRNQSQPVVDVLLYLKCAQLEGRLVLTIPWVVEYLSMIDSLAPKLQYYQMVFLLLLEIYRCCGVYLKQSKSTVTLYLVIICLGWLFEMPTFPEGMFFNEWPMEAVVSDKTPAGSLDFQNLVDHQILYTCCPYLSEMRGLLLGFAVGSSSKGSNIRKITPLSTISDITNTVTDKQLQLQLEENFFHNQPASLKRTVDFVADRVASNHIKRFRAATLQELFEEGRQKIKVMVKSVSSKGSPDNRAKKKLLYQLEDVAIKFADKGKKEANNQAISYCDMKVMSILPLLLPEETSPQVLQVSSQISCRIALEKVSTWLTTHITKGMFQKDLGLELEKQLKAMTKTSDVGVPENTIQGPVVTIQGPVPSIQGSMDITQGSLKATELTSSNSENAIKIYKTINNNFPKSASDPKSSVNSQEELTGLPSGDKKGQSLKPLDQDLIHKEEEFASPADVIIQFKEFLRMILAGEECDLGELMSMLDMVETITSSTQDLLSGVPKIMTKLSIDVTYAIVMLRPSWWGPELQDRLLSLWTGTLSKHANFNKAICPKHLYTMKKAGWYNPEITKQSWTQLTNLLQGVLQKRLISGRVLETSILFVLQHPVIEGEVAFLAECVCTLARAYYCMESDPSCEVFSEALDWLYQLCSKDSAMVSILQDCVDFINEARRKMSTALEAECEQKKLSQKDGCLATRENFQQGAPPDEQQLTPFCVDNPKDDKIQRMISTQERENLLENNASSILFHHSDFKTSGDSLPGNVRSLDPLEIKENITPQKNTPKINSPSGCQGDGRTMFGSLDNQSLTRHDDEMKSNTETIVSDNHYL